MATPRKGHSRIPVTVGKLVLAVIAAGALAAGLLIPLVGGIGLAADKGANQFLNTDCGLTIQPAQQATTVLASDGNTVLATLFAQNRKDIPLAQVPHAVQNALISTEDRRFYTHHGVDLRGLVRAAVSNSSGGGDTQGGSTLTMQYVKQVRYYQATTLAEQNAAIAQDLNRKIQDAKCAIDLEKKYSKNQILDDYFNIAFFGENSYGIETAAKTYFGVSASKLTTPQGALLVGLLQSPTDYDPFTHPVAAKTRRDQVLDNMVSNNELTAAKATAYKATPVVLSTKTPPPVQEGCAYANPAVANAGFFCDYVVDWLHSTGGIPAKTIQTGGLTIVTSLNASLQNSGQQAVWASGLDPKSTTALVMPSVTPSTGAVTTMITSRHYGNDAGETTLPLFSTGYAGSGSTWKYFTAIAALKLGVQPSFTLTTGNAYTVKNCPTNQYTTPYTVHNAGTYSPTLPLSDALPESVNTYFVGMEDQLFNCDLTPIVQTALNLGMTTLNEPDSTTSKQTIAQATIAQHRTTFTLGQNPTSALQLAAAYGATANDGVFCPADPVVSVTNSAGTAVKYTKPACTRQFSPQVARTMLSMMTADTNSSRGTAGKYFSSWYANGGSAIASKTGTDNDNANGNSALWFSGITPGLVSAAALVNPTNPHATVTGLPEAVSNNGSDVFGAYAATYWLDAYGPTLQSQQWTWPSATDVTDGVAVPSLAGLSPADATTALASVGLTPSTSSVVCGSNQPAGSVGYYEPHLASPGSKVTLCLSSGVTPVGSTYVAPTYNYNRRTTAPTQGVTSSAPASSAPASTPKPSTSPSR